MGKVRHFCGPSAKLPRRFRETPRLGFCLWSRHDCPKLVRKPLSFTRTHAHTQAELKAVGRREHFLELPRKPRRASQLLLQPEWAHNPLKTILLHRWLLCHLLVPKAALPAPTNIVRKPFRELPRKKKTFRKASAGFRDCGTPHISNNPKSSVGRLRPFQPAERIPMQAASSWAASSRAKTIETKLS